MARRAGKTKIVSKAEQAALHNQPINDPTLPPPGDARRDELKRRQEALTAEAEILAENAGAIDPASLDPDREILAYVNELEVTGGQRDRAYCWVWTGRANYFVKQKTVFGWKFVDGDMPEARELKQPGPTGLRVLGDTVLMWCPRERAEQIDDYYKALATRHADGVTSNLKDMARKYSKHGLVLHLTGEDLDLTSELGKRMLAKAAAQQTARSRVSQMIKDGNVPGMPAPRAA